MLGGNPNERYQGARHFNQGPFGTQGTTNPYGFGTQRTAGSREMAPMAQSNSEPSWGFRPESVTAGTQGLRNGGFAPMQQNFWQSASEYGDEGAKLRSWLAQNAMRRQGEMIGYGQPPATARGGRIGY